MKFRNDHDAMLRGRKISGTFLTCIITATVLSLVAVYVIGHRLEQRKLNEEPKGNLLGRFEEPVTIAYGGKNYQLRSKITSILLMGIDIWSERAELNADYRSGGQSDFLLLMVIDHEQKTIVPIQIDRDTMAEITILGTLGNVSGTRYAQICLSHGFGDGGEQSSLFTVDAVSKLLLGIPIDFYISLQLDAIATLNDVLGGVTVTLEDDFTSLDPTMTKGTTLTLYGKQAEYFARHRMSIGVGTNASRMVRQQQYLQKATDILDAKMQENVNYIGTVFDTLQPYMKSSMKRGRMINEAANTLNYLRTPTLQLAGEHIPGKGGFIEFHADEQALVQMVLDLFYREL